MPTKNLVTLLLLFICFSSYSQLKNYNFPKISNNGKLKTDFLPQRWKIIDSISGMFNEDKLMDIALVIQAIDSVKLSDTNCVSDQPFYPKILVILFANYHGGYILSRLNTRIFGDCNWGIEGQDPFDKLIKKDKSIGLKFSFGGTLRQVETYYFQFVKNDWYLSGATSNEYQQGQSASYVQEVNFFKGYKESYGFDHESNKKSAYKKIFLKKRTLTKLSDFSDDTDIPFSNEN